MLTALYRKFLPYTFRKKVYDFFLGEVLFFFRNFNIIIRGKLIRFFPFLFPKNEINQALAFIGRYGITSYPYDYMLEYRDRKIIPEMDPALHLPYVVHNGRKLYFPAHFDEVKIRKEYRALLIEQDERSAHRYVLSYNDLQNKTLLDVGCAEAIFALDTIDLVRHAYLFEYEDFWQKPLKATFEPWRDKVTIVQKYIGNSTGGRFITIDDFLKSTNAGNLFIKMDIEGAERTALEGAVRTFANGMNIQVAVCAYHRPGDPEHIRGFLMQHGFTVDFSRGLMYWQRRFSKGVVRGFKQGQHE